MPDNLTVSEVVVATNKSQRDKRMTIRMSLSGANRKTATVEIRELLNVTERSRLLKQLAAKRGVRSAYFSAEEPRRISVEYDADLVSTLGILDFFESCALHAQLSLRRERLTARTALIDAVLLPAENRPAMRT
ncbi:MAG: hypothetical protein ABI640_10160 [Gammaproteobacteria bacterium]